MLLEGAERLCRDFSLNVMVSFLATKQSPFLVSFIDGGQTHVAVPFIKSHDVFLVFSHSLSFSLQSSGPGGALVVTVASVAGDFFPFELSCVGAVGVVVAVVPGDFSPVVTSGVSELFVVVASVVEEDFSVITSGVCELCVVAGSEVEDGSSLLKSGAFELCIVAVSLEEDAPSSGLSVVGPLGGVVAFVA